MALHWVSEENQRESMASAHVDTLCPAVEQSCYEDGETQRGHCVVQATFLFFMEVTTDEAAVDCEEILTSIAEESPENLEIKTPR